MVTAQEMLQTLESGRKLGYVSMKGEGIEKKVIGAGAARLLLRIPDNGVNVNQLSSCYEYPPTPSEAPPIPSEATLKRWVEDVLLPAKLIYEKRPEVIAAIGGVNNADYTFHTSKPVRRTTSDDSGGYRWVPGQIHPMPDE